MQDNENNSIEAQSDSGNDQARERLLDAAEKLFAENGFDGTSVRSITQLAKCNIAAVNYHFGNKEKLYYEVVIRCLRMLRELRIRRINELMAQGAENVTLERLLDVFAKAFLEPLIDESRGPAIMQIMHREMLAPHMPKTLFLEETFLPVTNALKKALMAVCPYLSQPNAILVIHLIIAQLIHVVQMMHLFGDDAIAVLGDDAKAVLGDTATDEGYPSAEINKAVEHIVRFSSAAIRSYADGRKGGQV